MNQRNGTFDKGLLPEDQKTEGRCACYFSHCCSQLQGGFACAPKWGYNLSWWGRGAGRTQAGQVLWVWSLGMSNEEAVSGEQWCSHLLLFFWNPSSGDRVTYLMWVFPAQSNLSGHHS